MKSYKYYRKNTFSTEDFLFKSFIKKLFRKYKSYRCLAKTINQNLIFCKNNIKNLEKWLLSEEFKKRYYDSNHPYPSLIDPNEVDYKTIDIDFAWKLNLPFPNNYSFIWLYSHGSGMLQLRDYFVGKTNMKVIDTYLFAGDEAKTRYKKIIDILSSNLKQMYIIALSDIIYKDKKQMIKLFYLFSKNNISILAQIRDPIELIKHVQARKDRWDKTQLKLTKVDEINLSFEFEDVFIDENQSCFNQKIKITNFPYCFVYRVFLPIFKTFVKNIFYLDISEIRSKNIDKKLRLLSNKLNFIPPMNEDCTSLLNTNYFKGSCMLWLPLKLNLNEDCKVIFDFHHRKDWSNHINLYNELFSKKQDLFGIYIK
ncbi:hypothetical protein, partial [Campylobacter volucris]